VTTGGARLADHLFRREAGRMVATLVRVLGVRHLALAEDAVQDALVRALETWKFGRAPANPAAWLTRAARNRALDLLRAQGIRDRAAPALARALEVETLTGAEEEGDRIPDDELRLMFSCCDPALPPPAQVAVILKYLCGFSASELAQAFLTSGAAVEKQLYRARAALEARGALHDVRDPERLRERLQPVREAIYLLFSEGYHGAHPVSPVREELCHEALRLAGLLARLPGADGPETQALLSLLCLLAARLPARLGDDGNLLLLAEQDRSRWDRALVAEGIRRLGASAEGRAITAWHLEAAIAARHAAAPDFGATDWASIRDLYDHLLRLAPSPVVALNRAIAVGMADGPEAGLAALAAIDGRERLDRYPFLPAAEAELLRRAGRPGPAAARLREALVLARSPAETALLRRKLEACERPNGAR